VRTPISCPVTTKSLVLGLVWANKPQKTFEEKSLVRVLLGFKEKCLQVGFRKARAFVL